MDVAESPKIFGVQCIWRRIFVSVEKIFDFKYSRTIFYLVFIWNIYIEKVYKTFLGTIFWALIPFKHYQNTSGCGTVIDKVTVYSFSLELATLPWLMHLSIRKWYTILIWILFHSLINIITYFRSYLFREN